MQADDIGFLIQRIQFGICGALLFKRFVFPDIVTEKLAAEGFEEPGDDAANLSRADNADGEAVQVETYEAVQGEVPFAHAIVCAVNAAIESEQ